MYKYQWARHVMSILLAVGALALSGCGGSDGAAGAPGPGTASLDTATALNIEITKVSINSAPVVNFKVTNQDGVAVAGLTLTDLRFTIAKLTPGANGAPSYWQNYINTASRGITGTTGTYVRGNRENNGTLVDNKDGTYVYTFHTDITDPSQTCPAAPCIDADGNTIDTSYNANLTHRVAIQTRGSRPMVNGIYTFRPSDGATTGLTSREIVATTKCNVCHNKLEAHDARIETQYCVMCHNPGSTAKGQIGTVTGPTPVDFKVLIHKIHYGEELPSVIAGGDFGIYGFSGNLESFKDVVFPQDVRNCTKCHDGADTAQGDNWKTQPSKAACSACHDDLYFGTSADPAKPYQTVSHIDVAAAKGVTVGPDPDDGTCIQCHGAGQVADIAVVHTDPVNLAATKFQYNILQICGVDVSSSPNCTGTPVIPTVTFSVSDPTGATTHGYGNLYDVAGATIADRDPEFGTSASLNVLTAWDLRMLATILDYNNDGGSGTRPARANSLSALTNATDNGDGTFTITLAALPAGLTNGSGAVAIEGHPRGESVVGSGSYDISVPVKGAVDYFGINGSSIVARRVAVDIATKCDKCHNKLSVHGNNRADNAQLCVLCHNPRNTDVRNRPKDADGLPSGTGPDGKKEESIDFKRLIHGIHAAQRDDPTTPTVEGHGFREKGLVVYGYTATSVNEFGHVRFPGILNDCTTCHNTGAYELTGLWETPLQNGIQATTMQAVPDPITTANYDTQVADQTNDLFTTPTAAVCSACHDGATAQVHMTTLGGAVFNGTAAQISASYETCSVCHGPGKLADLNVVHGVP
jgi:OmcA/MtrC family decaheme c-type cytochrome